MTDETFDETFDLESLIHLEQSFYDAGHSDGFAHGRIHGLIEGRALGREKGFEMWEELGYYEGFALMWQAIYLNQGKGEERAFHHVKHLLEFISQFPRVNPSSADTSADLDIPKLFRQIRSRYKALCSSLGVRPSLRASSEEQGKERSVEDELDAANQKPITKAVWKLEPSSSEEMSF
ncbi:hypothetical protein BDP27DRAFT_1338108 [Rhodocollybia butyracea]|uniref:Essential protein Yae1 N-terminal domain-containing protein n=1 Tax=Rhodocollybia butyracea TaxID=206335 RepID=A0A9P5U1D3_9AGAR|nr:hypothetical protein BDP27DRAFT_1338108 [Rhodocollybia butyracea]